MGNENKDIVAPDSPIICPVTTLLVKFYKADSDEAKVSLATQTHPALLLQAAFHDTAFNQFLYCDGLKQFWIDCLAQGLENFGMGWDLPALLPHRNQHPFDSVKGYYYFYCAYDAEEDLPSMQEPEEREQQMQSILTTHLTALRTHANLWAGLKVCHALIDAVQEANLTRGSVPSDTLDKIQNCLELARIHGAPLYLALGMLLIYLGDYHRAHTQDVHKIQCYESMSLIYLQVAQQLESASANELQNAAILSPVCGLDEFFQKLTQQNFSEFCATRFAIAGRYLTSQELSLLPHRISQEIQYFSQLNPHNSPETTSAVAPAVA